MTVVLLKQACLAFVSSSIFLFTLCLGATGNVQLDKSVERLLNLRIQRYSMKAENIAADEGLKRRGALDTHTL